MFKIRDDEWNVLTVYGVRAIEPKGYQTDVATEFLIFENGEWIWIDARRFEPYEELSEESVNE